MAAIKNELRNPSKAKRSGIFAEDTVVYYITSAVFQRRGLIHGAAPIITSLWLNVLCAFTLMDFICYGALNASQDTSVKC